MKALMWLGVIVNIAAFVLNVIAAQDDPIKLIWLPVNIACGVICAFVAVNYEAR